MTTNLPNKTIYCQRSGLILASITALCSNGWPLLSHTTLDNLIHPVYGMPLDKLLPRFKDQLEVAEQTEWSIIDSEERELALSMSAIMYSLDLIWQPSREAHNKQEPSLPCLAVCIGTGSRLLQLAGWLHHLSTKRVAFPEYKVGRANNNLKWENFRDWLDAAFEIKADWEAGRTDLEREETLKLRTAALLTVKAEAIYKRIDFNKVWNWIDIQLVQDGRYAAGRRATFKTLFMTGDTNPEDWTTDDIEDVQMAIVECCDTGNEITFFINNRLNNIKAIIQDFYSSFTLLSHSVSDVSNSLDLTAEEQAKSNEFFAGFDSRAAVLTSKPEVPKRESFASLGLYLKATAQYNILSRRFDLLSKQQAAQQPNNSGDNHAL